ncbi:MAG TPA: LuxR C-terminal-related transcriptional regulator [Burkholderiales bacterium]|nr:LuxR C-terminal-related transcriptional regulator [Burkholderiales bacterium]
MEQALHVGKEPEPALMGPVVGLINSLSTRDFCSALLRHVNEWVRVDDCALVRMGARSIQAFGAQALQSPAPAAARALVAYLDRYHRVDPVRRLLETHGERPTVIARERASMLPPSDYRRARYDDPGVVERLSLAKADGRGAWVVLQLGRQAASGEFTEVDSERVRRLAPLLLATCLRHIELLVHAGADAGAWRARLAAACPAMSARELDVAAHLLTGRTLREAALALGVAYSSVVTYCGRAYSRLGVANLRELRSRFAAAQPVAA